MESDKSPQNSKLIHSLREAVGLVQMILFKELRDGLQKKKPKSDKTEISMLAGAITNEIFGTRNPEEKFKRFLEANKGEIEQELLGLKDSYNFLCRHITDALRIQALCDSQEGSDSSETLIQAKTFGYLLDSREIPLPSTFMTIIRDLGRQHNLTVPPVQITKAQDEEFIH